jgi:hypothetical protein
MFGIIINPSEHLSLKIIKISIYFLNKNIKKEHERKKRLQ